MDCVGESRIEAAIWCEKGTANRGSDDNAHATGGPRIAPGFELDSGDLLTLIRTGWFSGMENRCNEQSNDQRTMKGSPFDDPLSSNSKCNTSRTDGLRCCQANEILQTHECRRP